MSHALGESEDALPYVEQGLALAREIGERYVEAYALTALGHVLGALGQHDRARAAYQQSLALRQAMGHATEATETQAGLARLSLAGGDLAQAMGYVEDILTHLEGNTLEGTEQPLLVYLTCYRVLRASDDPRADELLAEGHRLLQEIAGTFADPELCRSFLENVPAHRELASEFERLRGR
jgi:tetratricopeptide (TPR) repeat protein